MWSHSAGFATIWVREKFMDESDRKETWNWKGYLETTTESWLIFITLDMIWNLITAVNSENKEATIWLHEIVTVDLLLSP